MKQMVKIDIFVTNKENALVFLINRFYDLQHFYAFYRKNQNLILSLGWRGITH